MTLAKKIKESIKYLLNLIFLFSNICLITSFYVVYSVYNSYSNISLEQILIHSNPFSIDSQKALVSFLVLFEIILLISLFLSLFLKRIFINSILFFLLFIAFIFCFPPTEKFFQSSNFIERNYKTPPSSIALKKIKEEKTKNIILIYLEGMDSSFFSDKNIMPYISQIGKENIAFKKYIPLYGTNGTIYSLISLTTGLPFKSAYFLSNPDTFLKQAPSIFDILKENNYDISFMFCGEKFTNKKAIFSRYGAYLNKEYFFEKAQNDERYIPKEEINFFCFDDRDTFKIAKVEIEKKAKKPAPFFFWIESVETHLPGFLSSNCPVVYQDIRDSYHCTDLIIKDFIRWLQQQDFYENTLIVLMGDHLSPSKDEKGKYILNALINSDKRPVDTDKPYTILDMGPTVLSAAGIKTEYLGLGTSLFSQQKTLVEKYDIDFIEEEIRKKSSFYKDFCHE